MAQSVTDVGDWGEASKRSYIPAKLARTSSMMTMGTGLQGMGGQSSGGGMISTRDRAMSSSEESGVSPMFTTGSRIRSVLAVITGASADTALFPMMLRFAQRSFIEVKVVVTSDRRTFPLPVREALTQFQKLVTSYSNITIEHLITPSSDIPSLIEQCSKLTEEESHFDMIAVGCSHLNPTSPDVTNEPENDNDQLPPPPLSRNRSQTIQEAFAPAIPDGAEFKRQLGLPESIASSTLAHPELGVLGCAIEEGGLANYLMVLHEPQGLINVARKLSIRNNPSVDSSNGASPTDSIIVESPMGHTDSIRTTESTTTVQVPDITPTSSSCSLSTSLPSTVGLSIQQRRTMFRIDEHTDDNDNDIEPSDIEIDVENVDDVDVDVDDDDVEAKVKAGGKDI